MHTLSTLNFTSVICYTIAASVTVNIRNAFYKKKIVNIFVFVRTEFSLRSNYDIRGSQVGYPTDFQVVLQLAVFAVRSTCWNIKNVVHRAYLCESYNKRRMLAKQPSCLCNDVECFLLEVRDEFISGFKGVSGTCHSHRWCSRSHKGYIIDDRKFKSTKWSGL